MATATGSTVPSAVLSSAQAATCVFGSGSGSVSRGLCLLVRAIGRARRAVFTYVNSTLLASKAALLAALLDSVPVFISSAKLRGLHSRTGQLEGQSRRKAKVASPQRRGDGGRYFFCFVTHLGFVLTSNAQRDEIPGLINDQ